MSELTGKTIGDKWQLENPLGSGTFGEVWVARHKVTGRKKALKLLHPQFSADQAVTDRFVHEAQIASRVDSPHVVAVDDIGVDDQLKRAYLVMELLKGESLFDYLVRPPYRMSPGETIVVLRQVCAALEAVHAVGVVHRDLKPENVFLSWRSDGSVLDKVLDFGIAKLADVQGVGPAYEGAGLRRTRTTGFIGTPGYASPEQVSDAASVTVTADIFALGICSFEMLTGNSYWRSDDMNDLFIEVSTGVSDVPSRRVPALKLSPAYDAWFMKACARNPEDRFGAVPEAIEALEEALEQLDPLPSPPPRSVVPQILETTGQMRLNSSLKSDPARASLTPKSTPQTKPPSRPPMDVTTLSQGAPLIDAGIARGTPPPRSDAPREFTSSVPPSEVPSLRQNRTANRRPWLVGGVGVVVAGCLAVFGFRIATAHRAPAATVVSPVVLEPAPRAAAAQPAPDPVVVPEPVVAEVPPIAPVPAPVVAPADGHPNATATAHSRRVRRGHAGTNAGPNGTVRANHSSTPYEPPGL